MAMSEHAKIRKLLVLAAAGTLTTTEEKQVVEHVRSCIICSNELEAWRSIATDLRRLPTPQPSSQLVQATLTRAKVKLVEQAEHDGNRRAMIFVVAFVWLLMVVDWPIFHFISWHFGYLLGPQFGRPWIIFAAFIALAWLEGVVAATTLALRQRGERRLV